MVVCSRTVTSAVGGWVSSRTMTSVSPDSPTRTAPAGVHTPSDASRLARASDSVCPKSSRAVKYKSYRNPWLRYGTVNSTIPSPPPETAGDGVFDPR